MVIAIDGPAGAGKSTVARALARELDYTYLDSGAMYRCVALLALRRGWGPDAEAFGAEAEQGVGAGAGALAALAHGARIDLGGRVALDGEDVTTEIRSPEVSELASRVAVDPAVRAALVAKQRELLAHGDWVAEGRDIGTVVAPDAELKIFLTADPRERARRRARELGADEQAVLAEQTLRDERDATREHSPLMAARGAIELNTTGLDVEQIVARIAMLARERDRAD
ncbi:MAG TPA: (d)CMP kinase [Solirubrobacteraceae bacterium]|jgi:cytidylate kinase